MDNNENISDAEIIETEVVQEETEVKGESLMQKFFASFKSLSRFWQGTVAFMAIVILFVIVTVMLKADMFPYLIIILGFGLIHIIKKYAGKAISRIAYGAFMIALIAVFIPGAYDAGISQWHGLSNWFFRLFKSEAKPLQVLQDGIKDQQEERIKTLRALVEAGNIDSVRKLTEQMHYDQLKQLRWEDSVFNSKPKEEQKLDQGIKQVNNQPVNNQLNNNQPTNVSTQRTVVNRPAEYLGNNTWKITFNPNETVITGLDVWTGDKIEYISMTAPIMIKNGNNYSPFYSIGKTTTIGGLPGEKMGYWVSSGDKAGELIVKFERKK